MWIRIVLSAAFVCALGLADLAPEAFVPTFERELASPSRVTAEEKERAAQFEYVFVGGFLGDYMTRVRAFAPIGNELARLGVPESQYHLICPPSKRTVEDNARNYIPERIKEIAASTNRKLVVIAHSKAGPEFLSFAFANPGLVEDRMEAIFFLQGAFGGSPLADLVESRVAPEIPTRLRNRIAVRTFRRLGRMLHRFIAGVSSLTMAESRLRETEWLRDYAGVIPRIQDKLLFVRSWATTNEAMVRLRIGTRYMKALTGKESDGVVPFESQHVPGLPAAEAVLDGVDHSLPCSWLLAWRGPKRAKALVRAVVAAIGAPSRSSTPPIP